MSKVTKRKITVESPGSKLNHNNSLLNLNTNKDSQRRQSVFDRLGTKTSASISINTSNLIQQSSLVENFCRHWYQNGTCPYGKKCVFVNTHILISPSKRLAKKDLGLESKQALARSLEEGLKRLHSSVVKRGSPELNWESWEASSLEYEDEKALEKRRQLLQRELELQMRQETEEHHSRRRHNTKQSKGVSSSSSTSVSSTSTDSSSSSDDSSSDSSSVSSKRRRAKSKKNKRRSTSSERNNRRKPMHKDRSPSSISKKSTGSRDKRAFTPPRKSAPSGKIRSRKKSPSPSHRRHATPPGSAKGKPSTSKSSSAASRHSKRSASVERKDKHKRSVSPRARGGKPGGGKERSPAPRSRPRPRTPDKPRSRQDNRSDDRKKDDDRPRNKDDRRQDRKSGPDRDKRDQEDNRSRDKTRDAAREKEREEALERCQERQRERERLAKEKERNRDRPREDREKDSNKQRDYDKGIPPLMSITTHNQPDRKPSDRDRDRQNKDRKDKDKDRDKDRERIYDRNLDKPDKNRPLDKDRFLDKPPERDREKEKNRDRDSLGERNREKVDRDRSFDRERNFDRGAVDDRSFDRDKDRPPKNIDRNRDRDFDRDKDRSYEKLPDNRRSFEKGGDRNSLEKDRGIVRDRGLERVLDQRERNKSLERNRIPDNERNVDRGRERFDREGRFDRRGFQTDEKGYDSPYDTRRDRGRFGGEGTERGGASMFKDMSPAREDSPRGMRHNQGFTDDRRGRGGGGRDMRGGWEGRGRYDDAGSNKPRDWDYGDSRREWDNRNRHADWDGGVEGDEWGRYSGGGGGDWGGGDWREEWQHRPPPRLGAKEDQTIVPSNHIVVQSHTNMEEPGLRRPLADSCDKDLLGGTKDVGDSGSGVGEGGVKRAREEMDVAPEAKKPRLDEPPSAMLEEALSDISDDPDEILNREDIDVPQDNEMDDSCTSVQPSNQELDQRLMEDRPSEDENIDNLDFEEISDEELEEEARANRGKGIGDALGVDWASLVSESRPRPVEAEPGAARRRWQPENILARIGVSLQYAGKQVFDQIQQKLQDKKEGEVKEEEKGLLHPVALLHVALRNRQARRKAVFSQADTFKGALSARADIALRRQLCNLPVANLELQQNAGFCQWVV